MGIVAFGEGREVIEKLSHASPASTSVNDDNIEKVKEAEIFELCASER